MGQAWDFSADPRISADFEIPDWGGGGGELIENLTLECLKQLFLIPEIPKVPTVGTPYRGDPPPTLGR